MCRNVDALLLHEWRVRQQIMTVMIENAYKITAGKFGRKCWKSIALYTVKHYSMDMTKSLSVKLFRSLAEAVRLFCDCRKKTTTYTYDAHDRLATVNGPWLASTVAFTYDGFGRMTRRTVNKVAHSFAYDVLSRLTSETSALGKITPTPTRHPPTGVSCKSPIPTR